jgi:hypothetical protein
MSLPTITAGSEGNAPMSITSKIVVSALLVGFALPALAQGPAVSPSVTTKTPTTTVTTKPAIKADTSMKTTSSKTVVHTGIARPATPATVKVN